VYFLTPHSDDEHLLIVTLSKDSVSKEAKWRAIAASGEVMSHEHV
jgi:hypothetical protein